MRKIRKVPITASLIAVLLWALSATPSRCSVASAAPEEQLQRVTANLPFPMRKIELPAIPARAFNVTDFGAKGDGVTLNTSAFAKAIEACSKAGGGRVVAPQGIWLTGPIQLKNNIALHVERGAVIQFSPRFDDYPLVRTTWEGSPAVRRMAPIYGVQLN